MSDDAMTHLQEIRDRKRKLLNVLELQEAKYGFATQPHILLEIKELKRELEQLDKQLKDGGVDVFANPYTHKLIQLGGHTITKSMIMVMVMVIVVVLMMLTLAALPTVIRNLAREPIVPITPIVTTQVSTAPVQLQPINTPSPLSPTLSAPITSSSTTVGVDATLVMPVWANITPTPALPRDIVFAYAAGNGCASAGELSEQIKPSLPIDSLDGRKLHFIPVSATTGLEEARRANAQLFLQTVCTDQQTQTLTAAFFAPPVLPIPLLREPEMITISLDLSRAQIFIRGIALYSAGRYAAALETLDNQAPVFTKDDSRGQFSWLWGNVLLRGERWLDAVDAYTQALEHGGERLTPGERAALLSNRAFTRIMQKLDDESIFEQCVREVPHDLDEALRLTPEVSDLHVLRGLAALNCPRDQEDIEMLAERETQLAHKLAPDSARVYDLQSQVGAANRAIAEIGDPQLVEQQACKALELDATLPGPQRTLGIIYARHQLAGLARARFEAYARSARFAWQRREAIAQWQRADISDTNTPAGLGTCTY